MTSSQSFSTHNHLRVRTPLRIQLQAKAKMKLEAAGLGGSPFAEYQFDAERYITEKLGWSPWAGSGEQPGQREVIEAYNLALRQQFERRKFEAGEPYDAEIWQPDQVIQKYIRVEAGHTVGKTKLADGLVNHFFDCFIPSIIYTFAPTWEQIHDLLWKEIKTDRRGKGLPGRILDLALDRGDNHFAKGRATSDAGGKGTERAQGQHGEFLMFVLDEAEGIAEYVYNAIDSMASGGIVIVLLLANPRTRTSRFHKIKGDSNVQSFRISCIHHPNVLAGREIIPGAVRRDYVETMLEKHAELVGGHDPDHHTFEVPWRPGVIYRPNAEFLFRVLGIAPKNMADNTLIPAGRYEAAVERGKHAVADRATSARMGVDVSRFGKDLGTLYIRRGYLLWRAAQFAQLDTNAYAREIKTQALALAKDGVTSLHIRIDGGGGFGGGVADRLTQDLELQRAFADFRVIEVHFGVPAHDQDAYANCVTELYAEAAETLKGIALIDPPAALEADLCERTYDWKNVSGREVKILEEKKAFKKRLRRSPDDGDGAVLATAPDYLFALPEDDEPMPSDSWSTYL
jgi:hypothetical protein